jgi:hypothetical protein
MTDAGPAVISGCAAAAGGLRSSVPDDWIVST